MRNVNLDFKGYIMQLAVRLCRQSLCTSVSLAADGLTVLKMHELQIV